MWASGNGAGCFKPSKPSPWWCWRCSCAAAWRSWSSVQAYAAAYTDPAATYTDPAATYADSAADYNYGYTDPAVAAAPVRVGDVCLMDVVVYARRGVVWRSVA